MCTGRCFVRASGLMEGVSKRNLGVFVPWVSSRSGGDAGASQAGFSPGFTSAGPTQDDCVCAPPVVVLGQYLGDCGS